MSDYWFETGLCLFGFYLIAMLAVALAFGIWIGIWPLAFLFPPLLFSLMMMWRSWRTRPSVAKRTSDDRL